ncbi:helix-turn-helix domain containing protein [Enterococcus sp. AZ109]|uniref:helix-turn-helix domain containing protein n=1 Tax=Enterococcus sp. AZ109 TaxID=2774634 RepID=UPI003F686C8C
MWTTKELQYLKDNALLAETNEVLNMKEMAKKIGRSTSAVNKKVCDLRKNGELPAINRVNSFDSRGRPWSVEEDKKLVAMKKRGVSHAEIAQVLERSPSSVSNRANRLVKDGKTTSSCVKWSKQEVNLLIENIEFDGNGFVSNYAELARLVNKRYEQVQAKVARLRKDKLLTVLPKKGTASVNAKQAMQRFNDARFASYSKEDRSMDKNIDNTSPISVESKQVMLILTTVTINGKCTNQYFTQDGQLIATKKEPTSGATEISK